MSDDPQILIVGSPRLGRPTRCGVRAVRPFQFYMTEAEKEALKSVAAAEGRKIAEIVRDAVNEYVADFGERHIFKRAPFE